MRSQNQHAASGQRARRVFHWARRVVMCLLVMAVWAAPISSAHALDKSQIIQMSKLGMETNTIKGAIDGAGKELGLSAEDVDELRDAGVDDEVIEYLEATGHVVEADDGDTETAGPAPGDDPGDDGPAPAPGQEEEDETYTEEEVEERIRQAEAEKKAEAERQRKIEAAARRLPRAKRAVDQGDNMAAAKTYLGFLALEPDPESGPAYEANFGLARALYNEGILSGAATPLLDVLMAGAQKPHFEDAFGMLQELTKRIGYQPPILEEMTSFYIGDMNVEFQNRFNYYMGKFFFDYGRSDLAIEYLDKVEEGASDYPEALYLMGAAQLDPDNVSGEALRNFERAIVAGEAAPGGNEEILQLGYLALARVFYHVGYYDVALYYYQKIPSRSARAAEATFERAWTYFMKNDWKRALGTFHTLHSPYYEQWYFPDLYVLEATVYLNLCQYGKSKETIARFQEEFLDKQPLLEEFLQETIEPRDYWTAITDVYNNEGSTDEGVPELFANAVLDDLAFYNIYGVIRTLRAERAALKANVNALGEFGQQVLDRVEQQLDTKIEEGGILVQQRLSEVNQELQDWDIKATQIAFDIESEEMEQLERQLRQQSVEDSGPAQGTTLLIVADDFTPWPFEGEYWLDEVSNYRSRLRSQCAAE